MKTNAKTRKTMPKEWQDFFKQYKGKYFKDGMECCVAKPESGYEKGFAQTAEQRTELVSRIYAESHDYKREMIFMDKFFGYSNFLPGIVDICCTHTDSGIYIYDRLEMIRHGFMLDKPKKRKNYFNDEEMGQNLYYRIPLHLCYKVTDLWDVPKKASKRRLYQMAVWQYVEMNKVQDDGFTIYEKVKTWEDLPGWCFWKWMLPDGTVIEGREEAFEEYKAKCRRDARYVPTVKSVKEAKNNE